MANDLATRLNSQFPEIVQRDVNLADITRWRIGGKCDFLVEPRNIDEVRNVLRFLEAEDVPTCVIGETSNLLFDSSGFAGVIIRIAGQMSGIEIDGNIVRALAGTAVPMVARAAADHGLAGIEHTVGIPGTIGGLTLMNGGSQRKGIGKHIRSVSFVHSDGRIAHLTRDECEFSYRHSRLQELDGVVVEVELELELGVATDIHREMDQIVRDREAKFPNDEPNCGSTFLSDPSMYATVGPPGRVIEDAGFKGHVLGGIQVSPMHANFLNNIGGATSLDALSLIGLIRGTVRERTGFLLDAEVRYVSPMGVMSPAHVIADKLGLSHGEPETSTSGY